MIAYNKISLRNMVVREQVEHAVHRQLLTADKQKEINNAYPVNLYSPNIFIRIGLGILTFFIVLAALGVLALISNYSSPAALFIVSGIACYGFLEFLTTTKKHYNSGVDNVLMTSVILLLTVGALEIFRHGDEEITASFCMFIISSLLALRFADSLMGAVASTAFLLFLFYSVLIMGAFARQIVPFIIIAVCGLLYFISLKAATTKAAFNYLFTLKAIAVVALIFLYIAGNYYVVRELSTEMWGVKLNKNGDIPVGWFFWFWTMAVPIAYVTIGIKKRDLVFTRLGIILSVFSVLTFRYYHHILSAEAAMLIAGTVLILVTYYLIKYLREPHHGFTFQPINKKDANVLNLEGIIIGEAFGNKGTPQQQDTKYGGGSFGGAGAGDSY